MKLKSRRTIARVACTNLLFGAIVVAGWSVSQAAQMTTFDDAVVLPTQQETQRAISEAGQRIAEARLASFDSPVADSDYLAAERDYDFGRYDQAVADATAAEKALPDNPNWIGK
jgi:hypothetical protein